MQWLAFTVTFESWCFSLFKTSTTSFCVFSNLPLRLVFSFVVLSCFLFYFVSAVSHDPPVSTYLDYLTCEILNPAFCPFFLPVCSCLLCLEPAFLFLWTFVFCGFCTSHNKGLAFSYPACLKAFGSYCCDPWQWPLLSSAPSVLYRPSTQFKTILMMIWFDFFSLFWHNRENELQFLQRYGCTVYPL